MRKMNLIRFPARTNALQDGFSYQVEVVAEEADHSLTQPLNPLPG